MSTKTDVKDTKFQRNAITHLSAQIPCKVLKHAQKTRTLNELTISLNGFIVLVNQTGNNHIRKNYFLDYIHEHESMKTNEELNWTSIKHKRLIAY